MRSPTVVEKHVHAGRFRMVCASSLLPNLLCFVVSCARRGVGRGVGSGGGARIISAPRMGRLHRCMLEETAPRTALSFARTPSSPALFRSHSIASLAPTVTSSSDSTWGTADSLRAAQMLALERSWRSASDSRSSFASSGFGRPRTSKAPLLGRDNVGRLCTFSSERMSEMSQLPGTRGWERTPSFDGLSPSQRGAPSTSARYGPGPEQFIVGVGDVHQTWRPRTQVASSSRPFAPPPRVAGLTKSHGSSFDD